MKKIIGLFSLAIITALFSSGCATITHGPNQQVRITSVPAGASVVANGELIGRTPLNANLSRKRAHEITIEKAHFFPTTETLRTVPNEASQGFIQFGIDEMVGAYADLEPSRVHVELDPRILPDETADDPASELTLKVLETDDLLEMGAIDQNDHRYIISRLLQFYE